MEVWEKLPIVNGYEVSNYGRVRSVKRKRRSANGSLHEINGRILKPTIDRDGYEKLTLCSNGHMSTYAVHRLVAITFLGFQEGKQVNHKNGVKKDNRIENLEWVTASQNMKHLYAVLGQKPSINNTKPTVMLSKQDEPMFIFSSIMDAVRFVGGKQSTIRNVIHGNNNTAYGLKWKFN